MARKSNKQIETEAAERERAIREDLKRETQVQEEFRTMALQASWTEPRLVSEGSYDDVPVRAKIPGSLKSSGLPFGSIRNFKSPFNSGKYGWDVEDAIRVCEGAYWNFPLLKNVVDVMAELSNSVLYLKGGNAKTRNFVGAWMSTVGIPKFTEFFFREYFRSGTCIIFKFIADHTPDDLRKITQMYGAAQTSIPVRYTIINPVNIRVQADFNFDNPTYARVLDKWEVEKIINPVSDDDKKFAKAFTKKQIADMKNGIIPAIPLDPESLAAVFYKKQPYEPMAVPMAYPLLSDINDKMEMKRKDADFVKKMDNALLLVNVGAPLDQFNTVSNAKAVQQHIQQFFSQQSVARVLVADHTVDVEWKIPDINKVLGTAKYEQIDQDLAVGLNAILFNSDEKFSNTSVKVQVFIERLKEARKAFLSFFQEEVKNVCQSISAQSYPEVYFEEISLKDELQYQKMYVQLAQLGLLTPAELFDAMDTGKIPTADESLDNQEVYYDQRKSGYYFPTVGGNNTIGLPVGTQYIPPVPAPAVGTTKSGKTSPGRPTGKTTSASVEEQPEEAKFSSKKLMYFTSKANTAAGLLCVALRKKFDIKRLSKEQKSLAEDLSVALTANEPVESWKEKVKDYVDNPSEISPEIQSQIEAIAKEHNLSHYNANILRLSAV